MLTNLNFNMAKDIHYSITYFISIPSVIVRRFIRLNIIIGICMINFNCSASSSIKLEFKYSITRSFESSVLFELSTNSIGSTSVQNMKMIHNKKYYVIKLTKNEYDEIITLFSRFSNFIDKKGVNMDDGSIWSILSYSDGEELKSFNSPMVNTYNRGLTEFVELGKLLWVIGNKEVALGRLY